MQSNFLSKWSKLIAGALLAAASLQTCFAALEWKATNIRLKAELGEEKAVAVFPFRNAGDQAVRIISVVPSCGCVAAKPGKEIYAPGESGEIRAELDLRERVGPQSKTITVTTDDASHQTTVLTLLVDIPEPVIIRPRLLFWQTGTKAEEKSAEIILTDPKGITLGEFRCNNPLFEVRLVPRSDAGNYLLYVKPHDTLSSKDAIIRLPATVTGLPQTYLIYLVVK